MRRRAGIALALALLAAWVAWLASPSAPAHAPAAVPAHAAPTRIASMPPADAPAPAAVRASVAGGTVVPAAAATEDGFVDVCGHGRVRRAELYRRDDNQPLPDWARDLDARRAAEQAALVARLAAGTTRQRVAAALMKDDVQAAAALAVSTTDAAAYRLALQACRRDAAYRAGHAAQRAWMASPAGSGVTVNGLREPGALPTACAALSLERLALLEPDSALPWLMRLADSIVRQDPAATSEALYQIAQRPGSAVRSRLLTETVAEQVDTTPRPGQTMALSAALAQDQISQMDGSFASVARACRAEALKDANRRQLCEQVVRQMPERTREVLEARVLHSLEERLGLSHSPQAMGKAEGERLQGLMAQERLTWMSEPSCANFGRSSAQIVAAVRQGEVAYLRERFQAASPPAPR